MKLIIDDLPHSDSAQSLLVSFGGSDAHFPNINFCSGLHKNLKCKKSPFYRKLYIPLVKSQRLVAKENRDSRFLCYVACSCHVLKKLVEEVLIFRM